MTSRARATSEADRVTWLGLLVTTTVWGLMLLPLVVQSGQAIRAAGLRALGVAIAGLIAGLVVREIRGRRGSARGPGRPMPEARPRALTWNEWLASAPASPSGGWWGGPAAAGGPAGGRPRSVALRGRWQAPVTAGRTLPAHGW
jgi:hypothetical protein